MIEALISAKDVREHLLFLNRAGMGYHTIAETANVASQTVRRIIRGKQKRCRARIRAALLSVSADRWLRPDGCRVSGSEARKIIRGLIEDGYTQVQLAKWAGLPMGRIQRILAGRMIAVKTDWKIHQLALRIERGECARNEEPARRGRQKQNRPIVDDSLKA